MCKKFIYFFFFMLVVVLAAPFVMASDMAFYTGFPNDGWYSNAQKDIDVAYIIAQTGHLFGDVQTFDDTQATAAGAWVAANINDGEMDIIWLPGTMPSVLYPLGNTSPDGSPAELWLDGGNMFINVADWFAYCSYEGGTRQTPDNGAGGAENILDLPGIITSADGVSLTRTAAGATYMPGLPATLISDRQVTLAAVTAPWEVSEIFAGNGTVADPIVIHNTATDAYMVFINQADIADTLNRGALTSQFLLNWAADLIGDNPYPRGPTPANGAIGVPADANLSWTRGDGALEDEVYFGTDPCALPKVATIQNLPPFPPTWNP
ncbi:MAG: hypothetical protein OEW48_18580, partial [Phycisphaerae bacterium]|nr:hypothetical protein [Phycisphaerae bacterium]